MKVLHVDSNHPLLIEQLAAAGFQNEEDYTSSKNEVAQKIHEYDGIIIRSRFSLDRPFLQKARNLKFIGRVGAGLENIDLVEAEDKGIFVVAAPEGNRNAVGEHTLGMLLSLMNKLHKADREVRAGTWDRDGNRGHELEGKTVGIYGYGNMGKAFAKKLAGFDVEVICYDIVGGVGDARARQVGIMELRQKSEVLSLHLPQTPETNKIVNSTFINAFRNPFWFLNTARGNCVVTTDLVTALASGKILGAGLDVLEYEKSSFEDMFADKQLSEPFRYLVNSDNVLLSPHVAGWTVESKQKLAQTISDKIIARFC